MESIRDRYSLSGVVGNGAYGNVFKAVHKQTNTPVAIKVIPKSVLQDPDARVHFDNEISITSTIDHPLIAKLYEVIDGSDGICIVSEYVGGRDLLHFINTHHSITEAQACKIFRQTLAAVKFLHKSHIAHRDLKPENILLDMNGNIRLIDFGFAKRWTDHSVFTSRCGSLAYVAPEIITGKPYGPAVDIWSLGVILYAMVSGELPFVGETTEEQLKRIAYCEPKINPAFSNDLKHLLRGMLAKNSSARLTIEQIEMHPWMRCAKEDPFIRAISTTNSDIDPEIVQFMTLIGLDTSDIRNKIECGVKSDEAIAYKILRRQKLTHKMGATRVGSIPGTKQTPRPQKLTPLYQIRRRNRENDPGVENDPNAGSTKLTTAVPPKQQATKV